MKITKIFSSLEQMIRRINAMASDEQMAEETKTQLLEDMNALDWIRSNLMDNMTKLAVVVGHSMLLAPFLSELAATPSYQTTKKEGYSKTISLDNLTVSIVVSPTDMVFQRFCDLYDDHKDFDSSDLHENLVPDHIMCNGYHIAEDENGRALLFNLSIRNKYISRVDECMEWARAAFMDLNLDAL